MKYVTLSDGSDGRTKQVFYYGEGEKADYRIGNLKKSQNGVLEAPGIEFTMSGALDADIQSARRFQYVQCGSSSCHCA